MNNLKSMSKTYHFDDGLGWLKFNFDTKSWWFYSHDGIPYNTKLFDINRAIYTIQLTKRVVAQIDGYVGDKNDHIMPPELEQNLEQNLEQ